MKLTLTRAADLRAGDRILSIGSRITYRPARTVVAPLGPIEHGSPVQGVRLINPNAGSPLELVLYPAHIDGQTVTVERDEHPTAARCELYLSTHRAAFHWSCGTCGATSAAHDTRAAARVEAVAHVEFEHASSAVQVVDVDRYGRATIEEAH